MEEDKDIERTEKPIDPANPSAGIRVLTIIKGELRQRMDAAVGVGKSGLVELSRVDDTTVRVTKCIRPDEDKRQQKWCLRILLRECEVYCRLTPHPRILEFYGFAANPDGTASLALEYMPNGDLFRYLQKHPHQSTYQRVLWCAQATEGLMHLHANRVIHSDLRPENMLVSSDDKSLRIIDFGGSGVDTQPSLVAEATRYFLPRGGDWVTNTETDRFALGSSFYYIMTGNEPYHDVALDLVGDQFAKKAYPGDVYDLVIGKVIVKCWDCKYKATREVYKDLYDLRDKIPRD